MSTRRFKYRIKNGWKIARGHEEIPDDARFMIIKSSHEFNNFDVPDWEEIVKYQHVSSSDGKKEFVKSEVSKLFLESKGRKDLK